MGKYDRFERYQDMQQPAASRIHPIWRGIGCMMLILIPIIAFAAADTFFENASDLSLFGSAVFPSSGIMYRVFFSFEIFGGTSLRFTPFHLVFTILFSVIGFMVFSFAYAVVYRVSGPPRYGPTDAPPPRRTKSRRRK